MSPDQKLTEFERVHRDLAAREARLRAILDAEPECVKLLAADGALLDMNPAGLRMIEAPDLGEVRGRCVDALVVEEHREAFRDLRRRVFEGSSGTLQFEIVGLGGTRRWLETHTSPLRDDSGRVIAALGLTRDITRLKQAEQRVFRLNRTYVILSEVNQLIVRERNPRALIENACRIAVHSGGLRMAWIGLFAPPDNRFEIAGHAGADPGMLALIERMLAGDHSENAFASHAQRIAEPTVCNDIATDPAAAPWREEALRHGFHAMVSLPLEVSGRRAGLFNLYAGEPGFFDNEELHLLVDLAADIGFGLEVSQREAENRAAEATLRAREEHFRRLIENATDLITIVDHTGTVFFQSPSSERILGYPAADLTGRPAFEWMHPDDHAQAAAAIERALADSRQPVPLEIRVRHRDGFWRTLEALGRPIPGPNGEKWVVVNSRDVTEHRRLEQLLRQAQKMEAIGQLAGGVAHDFNNILAAILMQVELTATVDPLPDEVREGLDEIRAAAGRAAELTRQLLLFSRRQVMQTRDLDLNELVTSIAKMLQRIIGEDIRLQLNLHPTPLPTHADAGMLDQILMNLAVNARDAMPTGGRLVLETSALELDEPEARLRPDAAPGHYVCLLVRDSGTGIPPAILPRIFEPFFTTKEPGKGTGLGLATVFGIVKQHRGWIEVQSEPGQGTTFRVAFPRLVTARDSTTPTARAAVRGGTETILLVEDDLALRQLTHRTLERLGYQVLDALNGPEAIQLWRQHAPRIALLLTDLVMPGGMSGQQLARQLRTTRPELKVLFTSGYSPEFAGRLLELGAGEHFVQKPCPPERLLEAVRRCLDD